MKKAIKKLVTLGMVSCLSVASCMTAFAGWTKDPEFDNLWMYQRDDGTYAEDCWENIDGKYYHFDTIGLLDTDCITSDGYHVDSEGGWLQDIPQMSQEEMDEYYKSIYREALIGIYENGFVSSEEEFEDYVNLYFPDPVEAEFIIDEIRSNHSLGSAQY